MSGHLPFLPQPLAQAEWLFLIFSPGLHVGREGLSWLALKGPKSGRLCGGKLSITHKVVGVMPKGHRIQRQGQRTNELEPSFPWQSSHVGWMEEMLLLLTVCPMCTFCHALGPRCFYFPTPIPFKGLSILCVLA